jgi:hypothetical protein
MVQRSQRHHEPCNMTKRKERHGVVLVNIINESVASNIWTTTPSLTELYLLGQNLGALPEVSELR